MGQSIVNGRQAAGNSTTRARALRKINLPSVFPSHRFEVGVRIDRKAVLCHRQHFRIPSRVAEGSVNALADNLTQGLGLARPRWHAYQMIAGETAIEFDF